MTNGRFKRTAFDADETDALTRIGWHPAGDGRACPDPSLLMAAQSGVLEDAALVERIREHVASCTSCQMLAVDLAAVLDESPADAETARIDRRIAAGRRAGAATPVRWLAPAGLLAAAVIAGVMFVPWRTWLTTEPPLVPAPADTGVVTALPTVFQGSRPQIPRPEPELTVRGAAAPVPLAEQLGQALDVADAGDLPRAIATLDDIVITHPRSAESHLALGATLLRADRAADALRVLEIARSLATKTPTDEIDWFLAVALARTQNTTRAAAILEPLCAKSSARAATACAGLAELRRNSK